jgi:DNA-binding MarR family transcriptional regulator
LDLSPVDVDTISRLRFATMRLVRLLRQHADPETGLSPTLISALGTLHRDGPLTLGRLAELERVQPPSMTKTVSQLEERGLVARETDAEDRRVARVRLLPAAEALLDELRTKKNEYLAARMAALDAEERAALEAALPALERLAAVAP